MYLRLNKWLIAIGLAGSLLMVIAADASESSPNATMRYAAASILSDGDSNRETTAALSLTFGDHWWGHVGAGKVRMQQANGTVNPTLVNLGIGVAGQQLSFTLDASRRKDGDRYSQRDWNSSVDWHNDTFGIGIDGVHRDTEVQALVPVTTTQGTVTVPVAESLRGTGVGLHAHANLTERLNVFAGGMRYHYDSTTRQSGSTTVTGGTGSTGGSGGLLGSVVNNLLTNRPVLAQQVLVQTSGVTREAAILQRSFNAGMRYRFDSLALTAQYFNDQALDSGDQTDTVQIIAAIFLDPHWTLAPAVGHSHNGQWGNVTFGSLAMNFAW